MWPGSKLEKEYVKAVYCHPAYLTYMQSTSCKMPGLDEAQAGIKIAERNVNNLRYAYDTALTAESEEELKRLLMKVKEESEKAGLKLNIRSSPSCELCTSYIVPSPKIEMPLHTSLITMYICILMLDYMLSWSEIKP